MHLPPGTDTSDVVLALDVGGTSIKAAVMSMHRPLVEINRPTRADQGGSAVLDAIRETIAELRKTIPPERRLVALGLAVAGVVDEAEGRVLEATNLGWHNLPLAKILRAEISLPLGLGHDVRSGGMAEQAVGAGRGVRDLAFIAVGTGIAAALIADGALIHASGRAGEIGHGGFVEGDLCTCGSRGCLETFASASGIARTYNALSGRSLPGAAEVLAAAQAGDKVAAQVWANAATALGALAADVARWLGPARIIIGGGLSNAGQALLTPLRAAAQARFTVHSRPDIVAAELGSKAGLHGAALQAWQALAT